MQLFNTGLEYLKIDIASNFGLDKKTWNERIDWYNQNESKLESLIKKADTPALFYAGMNAMKKAKAGEPSGYPISLDATSSGLQILACLTGDRKAAELCNVINTGKRQDAYTVIYHRMLDKIGGQVGVIKRDDTKQAILARGCDIDGLLPVDGRLSGDDGCGTYWQSDNNAELAFLPYCWWDA